MFEDMQVNGGDYMTNGTISKAQTLRIILMGVILRRYWIIDMVQNKFEKS